jgi:mono/diheme cytochrome c family protein
MWGRRGSQAGAERWQLGAALTAATALLLVFALAGQQPVDAPSGRAIYDGHGCSSCHGSEGRGGAGPALAGNPKLLNETYVIDQIAQGGGGMPPFHYQLSPEQIAAVASFVRGSWGNDLRPVGAGQVLDRRERLAEAPGAPPSGAQLFAWNCMICHGVEGGGGLGPSLAGNPYLRDTNFVVAQILLGGGGMPPFAQILDSGGIAAVASYIRSAWGNDFGDVSVDHVRLQWDGLGGTDGRGEAARDRPGAPVAASDDDNDASGGGGVDDGATGSEATGSGGPAGAQLYGSIGCAGCHSGEGAGGIGPPLDGNPALADADYVFTTIRDGQGGMPAFRHLLDDDRIALLGTYVRNAWTNDFGPVTVTPPVRDRLPASLLQSQADPIPLDSLSEAGAEFYGAIGCAGCHSAEGAGGIGPPLDGNRALADARYVVDTILTGQEQMPEFDRLLTDQQVAALATHVRTAWTNDFGPVRVEQVSRWRRESAPGSR